ncbi:hypothetical protein FEE95_03220 [Maribacter algarum]|uniref:Bacterial repeat domain-containing protein n=1 Tax=Maribacter algarum (ex Zhang et al. 2020) TaxID=2578118 RepID=A0A5S3PTZ0_9FLAO|nr:thrombospondin type 3 repeat-containing protein [Maribacter algarum]TMM58455.1 hypothetical protein FEE95_03220 [Maribacter algarum]
MFVIPLIRIIKPIFAAFILFVIAGSCSNKDEVVNFDLTTSIQPQEGGKVTPIDGNFPSDTDVEVIATANEGFVFSTWDGASKSSSKSITLTMDTHKQLTAIFEKLDSDKDGVSDDIDQCENTPQGESVNANGCSDSQKDTDEDGVTDDLDTCENTPTDETVDEDGCSDSQKDSDEDGVTDNIDECADTPIGESVNALGCSDSQIDSDGDGVMDANDECSETTSGEAVDVTGCSDSQKDTDVDGVTDDLDECADTPTGESVNALGCSDSQIDTDGDGVMDADDQCPETTSGEEVDVNGCSQRQLDSTLKTYVPDDNFEKILILLGYDYVIDDYVLTANIENLLELTLKQFHYLEYLDGEPYASEISLPIEDFTGLQDFVSLESLTIIHHPLSGTNFFDLLSDINLKKISFNCIEVVDEFSLKKNIQLEELRINGGGPSSGGCETYVNNLDLSNNPNLKVLKFNWVTFSDIDNVLANIPSLEEFHLLLRTDMPVLSLVNNANLRKIWLETSYSDFKFIDLKNGANDKLEKFVISSYAYRGRNICIEADLPEYVESIITAPGSTFVTNDCDN